MLAAGALTAVELMEKDPSMFTDLQEKCRAAQEEFSRLPGLKLHGDPMSVVKHLRLERSGGDREADKKALNQVVLKVSRIKNSEVCALSWQSCPFFQSRERGVALVVASYLEDAEVHLPPPSIRLTVSNLLECEDIRFNFITVPVYEISKMTLST